MSSLFSALIADSADGVAVADPPDEQPAKPTRRTRHEPTPRIPEIGDVVHLLGYGTPLGHALAPRWRSTPAVVLAVEDETDPLTRVTLGIDWQDRRVLRAADLRRQCDPYGLVGAWFVLSAAGTIDGLYPPLEPPGADETVATFIYEPGEPKPRLYSSEPGTEDRLEIIGVYDETRDSGIPELSTKHRTPRSPRLTCVLHRVNKLEHVPAAGTDRIMGCWTWRALPPEGEE